MAYAMMLQCRCHVTDGLGESVEKIRVTVTAAGPGPTVIDFKSSLSSLARLIDLNLF